MLAAAALLTTGCGYVGAPLTPLANVPAPVTGLDAVQRGSAIIVHFTVPTKTTENVDIVKPLKIDLRIGTANQPFREEEWASRATPEADVRVNQGLATCQIPTAQWTGKDAVIGARVVGANGKPSGWSTFQTLPVVAAPEVPGNLRLEDTANGVRVSWTARGGHFRVLRRTGSEEAWAVAATVDAREWTDTGIEYGKTYSYLIQTLVDVGDRKTAESDLSQPQEITPKDVFPPAVPTGLRADAAPTSIELSWDRNTETDLASYSVFRAVGDGPFEKIAEGSQIPSYSDRAVEHGKTYRYAVSAFDKAGNESARSAAVTAVGQ